MVKSNNATGASADIETFTNLTEGSTRDVS